MKLEVFWDLREFAKSMRLDFIRECLDKRQKIFWKVGTGSYG